MSTTPMQKKVCVIIPAKAVSKRVPGKNMKDLVGKPMMAYIIETAKKAKGVDRVIVTTESEEVKKVALKYGAEVPFIRPIELINDDTTTQEVMVHAINWLKENENYNPDYVLVVYPTSPLLRAERIDEAINLAIERDADLVFSGCLDKGHYWIEAEGGKWERMYPKTQRNSQYQTPLIVENGAICLAKTECYRKTGLADQAYPLVMEKGENVDVDYPEDFEKVEQILLRQKAQ